MKSTPSPNNSLRKPIIFLFFALLPFGAVAQKVVLGSCNIVMDNIHGVYKGEISAGKPHGKGSVTFDNGNIYEGEFVKGKRHGFGVYTFADGEKYEGEWFQNQQHGQGTYYFNNNNKYVGLWYRDYQQGHGIMYYYNGDKYEGNWLKDKRQGKGKYTYSNGAFYDGNWSDDQKSGKGFFDWGDGTTYEGMWANNQRTGKGTNHYADGDIYVGDWLDDIQNGRGIYKFQNGDVYEGEYVQGERHRVYGNVFASIDFTDWLNLMVRCGMDLSSDLRTLSKPWGSHSYNHGRFQENIISQHEINTDFLLKYDDKFGDFSISAMFGGNIMTQGYSSYSQTAVSLEVPGQCYLCAHNFHLHLNFLVFSHAQKRA